MIYIAAAFIIVLGFALINSHHDMSYRIRLLEKHVAKLIGSEYTILPDVED